MMLYFSHQFVTVDVWFVMVKEEFINFLDFTVGDTYINIFEKIWDGPGFYTFNTKYPERSKKYDKEDIEELMQMMENSMKFFKENMNVFTEWS